MASKISNYENEKKPTVEGILKESGIAGDRYRSSDHFPAATKDESIRCGFARKRVRLCALVRDQHVEIAVSRYSCYGAVLTCTTGSWEMLRSLLAPVRRSNVLKVRRTTLSSRFVVMDNGTPSLRYARCCNRVGSTEQCTAQLRVLYELVFDSAVRAVAVPCNPGHDPIQRHPRRYGAWSRRDGNDRRVDRHW